MLHDKLIRLAAIPLVMIMYASTAKADLIAWYPLHGDTSPKVGEFYGDLVNAPTPASDEKGNANGAMNLGVTASPQRCKIRCNEELYQVSA